MLVPGDLSYWEFPIYMIEHAISKSHDFDYLKLLDFLGTASSTSRNFSAVLTGQVPETDLP